MRNKIGNGGFSLVELIVVIAIMAILAAVAVVGVSVYVDKAAEAADRQTIADIEDALVLGGYSGGYAPGTVVGVVSIGKGGADCADNKAISENNDVINQIMIDAFGANWKTELKLQSDVVSDTDEAKLMAAVNNAPKDANGKTYFDSVPDSSFYKESGNTVNLAKDVDQVAAALNSALEGMGGADTMAYKLWSGSFQDEVSGKKLDYSGNGQMAANLTVFAVANSINNATAQEKADLVNTWVNGTDASATDNSGMGMPLAMNFARCTAIKNFVANGDYTDRDKKSVDAAYKKLMTDLEALKDCEKGKYLEKFNEAIGTFEIKTSTYRTEWEKEQAKTDAEAFIASMAAVDSLKSTYVSQDKVDVLGSESAFFDFGAADKLDAMVQYAQMGELNGDFDVIITLSIDKNGVPTVSRN